MKSIKINRLISSLAAVLLIFGAFFIVKAMEDKQPEVQTTLELQWFDYISDSVDPFEYELPENYQLSADPKVGQNCPVGTTIRCKIKALPSASDPNLPDMNTVTEEKYRGL